MHTILPKSSDFGRAFEHIILNEVRAYLAYTEKYFPCYFWRTRSGYEVDLIVGDLDLCVEIKASEQVMVQQIKGLKALQVDQAVKKAIVVSMDKTKRQLEKNIVVFPWQEFVRALWAGELI